jgi:hypothetical protein
VRPEGLGKFKNSPHRESNPRPSGLYFIHIYIQIVKFPLMFDVYDLNISGLVLVEHHTSILKVIFFQMI